MKSRAVKIVKKEGTRRGYDVDVFDLETGEKLEDVYKVEFCVTRDIATIRITSGAPWVYEGPAEIITPEESAAADIGITEAQYRALLQRITEDQVRASELAIRWATGERQ